MATGFKSGGRQKGTPNKDNPLKPYIVTNCLGYFTEQDEDGHTQWEKDLSEMSPEARVAAQLKMLGKVVPDMKAVDANVNTNRVTFSIEDRLRELCGENNDDEE